MTTVATTLKMYDQMTGVLKGITSSLHMTLTAMDEMQRSMDKSFDSKAVDAARKSIQQTEAALKSIKSPIEDNTDEQEKFNDEIAEGEQLAGGLYSKIIGFVGAYAGVKAVSGFFQAANAAAREQIGVEQRLQTIMGNINGMTQDGIELVKERARALEGPTAVSAAVGIAGQSQLAEYVYDPSNIAGMTEAMYNLATETYGANISADQLQQTANLLGKVMMGDINALSRNGFKIDAIFSEAEQKLLKTGTEAERAAMVISMIDENLAGLAEAMGNTPEGEALKFANAMGAIQEKIGYGVIPMITQFQSLIMANLPAIEQTVTSVFGTLITVLTVVFEFASAIALFFIENWSLIAPILMVIVGAFLLYQAALAGIALWTGITTAIDLVASAAKAAYRRTTLAAASATAAETAAQWGLNAAMLASPITWIILIIIALIGLIYLVVAAINKWTGTTTSATGLIAGAFAVLGSIIANIFMGLLEVVFGIVEYWYNMFIGFANFFANLFNDPIGSIIKLFGDLADSVLGVLEKIASAMDFIFGSSMADTVKGWRVELSEMTEKAVKEHGNGTYEEKFDKLDIDSVLDDLGISMDRLDYGEAWDAGYDWGDNLSFGLGDDLFKMPELPGAGSMPTGAWDVGDGTLINGGKLDEVGKINDTVDISSEDLKTMRELAEMKNIQNFVTLQPQMTFGDTNIRQDGRSVDEIVSNIAERMEQEIAASARGMYDT